MADRFPFPANPNGWFRAAYGDEIAPGQVKPLSIFGRELVLFREQSGKARILDAYCRHLGAHLGHGGRVDGDRVRCPFHAWLWDGEGRCCEIPYAKRIPPSAKLRAWPVLERNGIVWVWHHDRGDAPSFDVPELGVVGNPDWSEYQVRRWRVRSRWLDMNENAVDRAHFVYVHGARTMPEASVELDGHILRCRSRMKLGTPRGEVAGGIDTTDYGPGLQVVELTGITHTIMVNTTVPLDDEYTDVSFAYTVQRQSGRDADQGVGAAIIRDLEKQMAQDIPIWENKRYYEKPLLCDGDGAFATYRRWMQQFFSPKQATG
jgi:nitrite reductase/ring-hydroxylating ferredoxin subunit